MSIRSIFQLLSPKLLFLGLVTSGLLLFTGITVIVVFDLQFDGNESNLQRIQTQEQNLAINQESIISQIERTQAGIAHSIFVDELIMDLGVPQLLEILEVTPQISDDYKRHATQDAIFGKLTLIAPKTALSHINDLPLYRRMEVTKLVAVEWSGYDLEEAIAQFDALAPNVRDFAIRSVLEEYPELADGALNLLAASADNEIVGDQEQVTIPATNQELSNQVPNQSWRTILADNVGDIEQTDELVEAGLEWIDQEGFEVLDSISESLSDAQLRVDVKRQILLHYSQKQPDVALKQAIDSLLHEDWDSVVEIASDCARNNPIAAYRVLHEMNDSDLNLELQKTVVKVWAQVDAYGLLKELDILSEKIRNDAFKHVILSLARESPQQASKLLLELDSNVEETARAIVNSWASSGALDALKWVISEPKLDSFRDDRLIISAVNGLSTDEAEHLLRTENGLTQRGSDMELERLLIATVAIKDVDRARKLLSTIKNDEVKTGAFVEVGSELVYREREDEAMDLALELEESQREQYYRQLVNRWAGIDPDGLYVSIIDLPTRLSKSAAAMRLSAFDQVIDILPDDKIEHLKSYLTKADANSLRDKEVLLIE